MASLEPCVMTDLGPAHAVNEIDCLRRARPRRMARQMTPRVLAWRVGLVRRDVGRRGEGSGPACASSRWPTRNASSWRWVTEVVPGRSLRYEHKVLGGLL